MTANISEKGKVYDALIIPTGETTFKRGEFPVTDKAIELFKTGRYGYLFITGGYSGFATKKRLKEKTSDGRFMNSEGRETYDYILYRGVKGLNQDNVYYDDQSLESLGNFVFPIAEQIPWNPNLLDFKKMQVIGKEGHLWRLRDYANLVLPGRFSDEDFISVPGEHNNGYMAKFYHKALLGALETYLAEHPISSNDIKSIRAMDMRFSGEILDFLTKKHPFYSEKWFGLPVALREGIMAWEGAKWRIGRV